jgi:DNA repair protein RadD
MKPRPYQQAAVDAVWAHLQTRDDAPCVVLPTAAGKTIVLAVMCRDAVGLWSGRVLILAHVKELLAQGAEKLRQLCPEVRVGIYSAGLKRRDTTQPVILAGIQSVHDKACDLGAFDLIIVDEAHLIPLDGDGMYQSFIRDMKTINPRVRVVGLTATAFRLGTGEICTPDGVLNHVCYEISVKELIADGFLCPLVSKEGVVKADLGGVHVRNGEFIQSELEAVMDDSVLVESAVAEIVERTRDRQSVLIFAAGVEHGKHIVREFADKHGRECAFISGQTAGPERDAILRRFKGEPDPDAGLFQTAPRTLKYLCNVNVLTTGFDAPATDCVALLRATMSPGLLYQMVGRGFRLHERKSNCLVLDYGGNIERHGPVDALRIKKPGKGGGGEPPAKTCPACKTICAAGCAKCPDCGHEFPPPVGQTHNPTASNAGVLSGQVSETKYVVLDVMYRLHTKRHAGPDAPRTMRVDYRVGLAEWKSEWVCFEHEGFARHKAERWWKQRSHDPVPATAERAVEIAEAGGLALATAITVRQVAGDEFERIVGWDLGEMPEAVPQVVNEPSPWAWMHEPPTDRPAVGETEGCRVNAPVAGASGLYDPDEVVDGLDPFGSPPASHLIDEDIPF